MNQTSLPPDAVDAAQPALAERAWSGRALSERPLFVALSRFVIANGMDAEVKAAFRARPHRVDEAPGFVAMQVLCPVDAAQEIWLFTQWRSADDYHAWHHGHTYRDSHRGIPKGLKLVGRETQIREFDVICD